MKEETRLPFFNSSYNSPVETTLLSLYPLPLNGMMREMGKGPKRLRQLMSLTQKYRTRGKELYPPQTSTL